MKKIVFLVTIFISAFGFSQDSYNGKWSLGQNSSAKWYKVASFDFAGNGSYNSVIADIDVNYVRTTQKGYTSRVQLIMREGPTVINAAWNYSSTGTEAGELIKFKKVSAWVYELFAYSPGGWSHLSVNMSVTKEAPLIVNIPTVTTEVNNPDGFEEVLKSGNSAIVSGNLGIGITNPGSYRLAVNGNIHAKEVKVDLIGWPDFVFKKNYGLPSLEEVAQHIKEKGHLKDIPSAKEVAENGIFLGEMDSKLLQKIEELMLYTIQQQKEIQALKKEVQTLKNNRS